MTSEMTITFEGTYIQAVSNGEKNLEVASLLWSQIAKTCEKHQCFKVLGIANSSSPVSTTESVDHIELFQQLGITRKYRIAWVELNHESARTTYLIENLLSSHGLTCRMFMDIQEAKEWLFYGRSMKG